jgi:putative transposase
MRACQGSLVERESSLTGVPQQDRDAMDITYIPMARGFVYLAVVLDWSSRRVLAWRLSITMEATFCIEALTEALARYGKPDVFNTDQGSQFTARLSATASPSVWTARAPGVTTCSSSGVAQRQIRGGLSARLRQSQRGPRLDRPLLRVLQSA